VVQRLLELLLLSTGLLQLLLCSVEGGRQEVGLGAKGGDLGLSLVNGRVQGFTVEGVELGS
jgi:hypothetical protein